MYFSKYQIVARRHLTRIPYWQTHIGGVMPGNISPRCTDATSICCHGDRGLTDWPNIFEPGCAALITSHDTCIATGCGHSSARPCQSHGRARMTNRTHDEPPREPRTHVASKKCSSSLAATLDQFDAHKHVDQLFQLVGPHECCACGRAATRGCTLHARSGRLHRAAECFVAGPDVPYCRRHKGSSHRVDLHGTSRVQVHDATRATRLAPLLARGRHTHMKRRGTAAGSAAGRARQVRVHRGAARACGDHSPPKSASLGSIALVRASLHSAAQHSTRQQEARGAHPRTPADSAA